MLWNSNKCSSFHIFVPNFKKYLWFKKIRGLQFVFTINCWKFTNNLEKVFRFIKVSYRTLNSKVVDKFQKMVGIYE